MKTSDIKRPTMRKVLNRGYEPVRYRTDQQVVNGWIIKRGRTLLHIRIVGRETTTRVPLAEERYMTPLKRGA